MASYNLNNNEDKSTKKRSWIFKIFLSFGFLGFMIFCTALFYSIGVDDGINQGKQDVTKYLKENHNQDFIEILSMLTSNAPSNLVEEKSNEENKQKIAKLQEEIKKVEESKKKETQNNKPKQEINQKTETKSTEKKQESKNVSIKSNYKNIKGNTININNSQESFLRYYSYITLARNAMIDFLSNVEVYCNNENKFSVNKTKESLKNMRNSRDNLFNLAIEGIPESFIESYNKFCESFDEACRFAHSTFEYELNTNNVAHILPKYPSMMAFNLEEVTNLKLKAYNECKRRGYTNLPQ